MIGARMFPKGGAMPDKPMRNIFALTGAGISAESGVRTYRGDVGLWEDHAIDDIATFAGFVRDPALVLGFYDARHADIMAAAPNAAHEALARLEADGRYNLTVVTQNIDDLHERAGSRNVIHIHGEITGALCSKCGEPSDAAGRLLHAGPCPSCGYRLRPDIVWFGEYPKRMDEIEAAFLAADTFLSIGTSGEVSPASEYARRARNRKLNCVEFNIRETDVSHYFRHSRKGPASLTVPAFVEAALR